MSFCRNRKSVNSFSEAFHQTPSLPPNYYSSSSSAGDLDSGGEGPVALLDDFGLMSCTESLGFESSDEISTVEYDRRSNENDDDSLSSTCSSSSSSSASSCSFYGYDNSRVKRWRSSRRTTETEKRSFPPPLTSMSENGRRNFMLKPIRKDGRLEIVGVRIECPEILCATRCNGRLTMRFVKSVLHEQDEDEDEETEEEERENEEFLEELGEGKTEEERENGEFVEEGKTEEEREFEEFLVKGKTEEEREIEEFLAEEETEEEEAEEEREWKFPAAAAGLRRCYHRHELHVWGQQQQRCVTSM